MKNTGVWALPCPRKGTLFTVFMGLILATGMAGAYDSEIYGNVGWGLRDGVTITYSPLLYRDIGAYPQGYVSTMYIQTEYAGNYSFSLDVTLPVGGVFHVYGLNYTNGIEAWIEYHYGNLGGREIINLSAYSNVGIFKLYENYWGGGNSDLGIYPETSYMTFNGVPDYFSHSYMAGGKYTIPLVNRFYPQTTYVYGNGVDIGIPVTATNASAFYYTTFQSSCSSSSGIILADVDNWFDGVPAAVQQYSFYLNMTSITPLNFTVYSPATTPNISLTLGESKTFSVAYSPLESLSAVAWYVNNGLVQYGTNTTYVFNESIPGTYFLECQLEDNICSQYPTIGWYISVGKTTSISGSTWGILGGLTSVLPDTTISLFNTSLGISTSTVSDGFGDYAFGGLPAGGYNLTASKTGYYPVSAMVVTYYGYFSNTNFNKNFILTGGAPTTTTTTSTIATTTTLYAGCIGSLTDNCAYYDNDSLSCSLRYACAGGYCFQCAYSVPNYCSVDQLCSATTTTSTTSGTTSTTSGTTSTTSGTTSTTSGTTTTIPTTTSSSVPPTTIHQWNGSHVPVTANCTNLTAQLAAGDWFHPAMCAYIIPLGVDWTYGLLMLMVVLFSYKVTNTWVGPGVLALFISSMFFLYLPQPTLTVLALGVIFGLGSLFYGLFFEFAKEKDRK